MYTKVVLEHFRNPKFAGDLPGYNATGKVGNAACGDIMELFLKIKDGVIAGVRFKTFGCAAAIASTDILCGLINGKTIEEAKKISKDDIIKVMGEVPAIKVHCSILATEALEEALKNFKE